MARITPIALPDATRCRLGVLAQLRRCTIHRVIEDLIDEASRVLPVAVWEQAAHPDAVLLEHDA
jgi:hypothetical protein